MEIFGLLILLAVVILSGYGFVYSLVMTITLAMKEKWWTFWAGFTAFCLLSMLVSLFIAACSLISL